MNFKKFSLLLLTLILMPSCGTKTTNNAINNSTQTSIVNDVKTNTLEQPKKSKFDEVRRDLYAEAFILTPDKAVNEYTGLKDLLNNQDIIVIDLKNGYNFKKIKDYSSNLKNHTIELYNSNNEKSLELNFVGTISSDIDAKLIYGCKKGDIANLQPGKYNVVSSDKDLFDFNKDLYVDKK